MPTFYELLTELRHAKEPTLKFSHRASQGITRSGQRLGVFSGSFNPPTIAHVRLCQQAQTALGLDEVLLLLAVVNVDKPLFGFPLEERLAMMVAIAKERSDWSVALCSHGRFVEKADAVVKAYPDGTGIWFLVGYDTLVRIFERRFYTDMDMYQALQRLFAPARLAVMPRADADEAAVRQFLGRLDVAPFSDRIVLLPTDPSTRWVSSTLVREKLERGEPIDDLVPEPVAKLLQNKRLANSK